MTLLRTIDAALARWERGAAVTLLAVTVTAEICAACSVSLKSMRVVSESAMITPARVCGAKPIRRATTVYPLPTSRPMIV